jgi:transposase-like protein
VPALIHAAAVMIGLAIEFSLVVAGFLYFWRRQIRERERLRERASQLDFDFPGEHGKMTNDQ